MKHQTAVEWLIEQIFGEHINQWKNEIERAKEMEREQIIDAYCDGNPQFKDCGEEYYDEAYKK